MTYASITLFSYPSLRALGAQLVRDYREVKNYSQPRMITVEAECDFNTDWTVDQLLAALPGYRRVDDGADLLAFILRGRVPGHTAYIYLFGQGRRTISYDLEDWARDTGEWDHAVERSSVTTIEGLVRVCRRWLDGEA